MLITTHDGSRSRRLARLALLTAVGLALHAFEDLLPVGGLVPGAKPGLANVATLVAMASLGPADAVLLAGLRTTLGSLLGGTFLSVRYLLSLSGALASAIVMVLLWRNGRGSRSLLGVSLAGGVVHNLAQLAVAGLLIGRAAVLAYLPYLVIFGVAAGLLTGATAATVCSRAVWTGLGGVRVAPDPR
ncbi:MAG: Gx transporter family protein [bacterium]|nr:Gx transporter family protein [bacterium]